MKSKVSNEIICKYLEPLQPWRQGDDLILYAPNQHVIRFVEANLSHHIDAWLSENSEIGKNWRMQVGDSPVDLENSGCPKQVGPEVVSVHQEKTCLPEERLNMHWTFDNYVEGQSNRLACQAARSVACQQDEYNPLVITGGCGFGKTHLMHAIGHSQLSFGMKVLYVSTWHFVSRMMDAFRSKTTRSLSQYYRSTDVLLLDDIQFSSGKEWCQLELLHIFSDLMKLGKLVIITWNSVSLKNSEFHELMKSRMNSGLNVYIKVPDVEMKTSILVKKSKYMGLSGMNMKVAEYIAESSSGDIRELEGILQKLKANHELTGRNGNVFSMEEVREFLNMNRSVKPLSMDCIIDMVASHYNVRVPDLLRKIRVRSVVRPRQVAMWLARKATSFSLPDIGKSLGNRNHSTVLNACRRVDEIRSENREFQKETDFLIEKLRRS